MAGQANSYDVIVVGLGVIGAAALEALARAGVRALGVDQFVPPHEHGSSHGETRLVRLIYTEGAHYVPLARRAIAQWRELEARTGESLFHETGVLYCGRAEGPLLRGVHRSAKAHGLALEREKGVKARFGDLAGFDVPKNWHWLYEKEAGYVLAEKSVEVFLRCAQDEGADLRTGRAVQAIERDADGFSVQCGDEIYRARRLVVTAGPWAAQVLPLLKERLWLERQVLFWVRDFERRFSGEAAPFAIEDEDGVWFYGFPPGEDGLTKIACHKLPGERPQAPDAVRRDITHADWAPVLARLRRFLPGNAVPVEARTCLYTMSPDEDFIIDRHPQMPGLVFAAGFSGHGFKFAPALGEMLAQMALDRAPDFDASVFSLARFAGQ